MGGNAGDPSLGQIAWQNTAVVVLGCEPLVDSGTPGDTAISVKLDNFLGALSCGDESGEVSTFTSLALPADAEPTTLEEVLALFEDSAAMGGMGGMGGNSSGAPDVKTNA